MDERKSDLFHLLGWVLFIVSAFFFIWAALHSGDILGFLGGFFFLIACFVFLVPLIAKLRA